MAHGLQLEPVSSWIDDGIAGFIAVRVRRRIADALQNHTLAHDARFEIASADDVLSNDFARVIYAHQLVEIHLSRGKVLGVSLHFLKERIGFNSELLGDLDGVFFCHGGVWGVGLSSARAKRYSPRIPPWVVVTVRACLRWAVSQLADCSLTLTASRVEGGVLLLQSINTLE